MKVYGTTGYRVVDGKRQQTREVGAFSSIAKFIGAAGLTRADWNWYGGETGNDEECALALGHPGYVFYRSLNALPGSPWASVPLREKAGTDDV